MLFEEMLEQLLQESQMSAMVELESNLGYMQLTGKVNKTLNEIESYLPEDKKSLLMEYKEEIWDQRHFARQDVAYRQGAYDSVKILRFLKVI